MPSSDIWDVRLYRKMHVLLRSLSVSTESHVVLFLLCNEHVRVQLFDVTDKKECWQMYHKFKLSQGLCDNELPCCQKKKLFSDEFSLIQNLHLHNLVDFLEVIPPIL